MPFKMVCEFGLAHYKDFGRTLSYEEAEASAFAILDFVGTLTKIRAQQIQSENKRAVL